MSSEAPPLTDAERAILLDPCECGHTLNDHGSLAGCWMCAEETQGEDGWCRVECEALIAERVARIVARRMTEPNAQDSAERKTR